LGLRPGLVLAQHPDDLLLAKATPFHRPSPFQATDSTSFRLSFRGAGHCSHMDRQNLFSDFVASKIKCYVYRLIDPRNGITFYVGRGRGNRIFSHAAGKERPTDKEDSEALKLRMIRAVKAAGFQVEHVVHRHGMDETAAKEVEAALIDAYPGLANIQLGYQSDRGVMHAKEIVRKYEAEEAVFQHNVIFINVNRSSEDRELIDATRYCWKISPKKALKADYVLAIRRGMIIGAFMADEWVPATPKNFPGFPAPTTEGRFGFRGREAPQSVRDMYVGKRVPTLSKGAANPIRYEYARA
ncbi:MAG TPA: hypothetical protein VJX23_13130, partial [Candidatus Binataceae bacterium]|nr:hypothetical protein [Candidatus Binataceae bacterium]